MNRLLSIKDIIQTSMHIAVKSKKPLFIGEIGASGKSGKKNAHKEFKEIIKGIKASKVPLAALRVFDFSYQNMDWNITASNGRQHQIEAIRKFNDHLK